MEVTGKRFVGIDLGKRTWEMVIVKQNGKLEKDGTVEKKVFHNGKTSAEGRATLYKKLESGDTVALEAGNLAFIIAKEIEKAVGCKVIVLNPYQLAVIYASYKKTDKEDALKLPGEGFLGRRTTRGRARAADILPTARFTECPYQSEGKAESACSARSER